MKKIEITQVVFSDYNTITLELNNRGFKKFPHLGMERKTHYQFLKNFKVKMNDLKNKGDKNMALEFQEYS